MTEREALKLALEALEAHADIGIKSDKAITAIKEALAQPEQEPFAFLHPQKGFYFAKPTKISAPTIVDVEPLALYTTPPLRKPLTDEEERKAFEQWYVCNAFDYERNPIGSRECGLQWSAWKARAAHGIKEEK